MDTEVKHSLRQWYEDWLEKHFGPPSEAKEETTDDIEVAKEATEDMTGGVPVRKSVEEDLMQATFVALLAYPDDTQFDLHGDTYDADEVRKACHNFNQNCMKANIGHAVMIDKNVAMIVESYTSDVDMQIGDQYVPAGSWLQKWQFADDSLWEDVKKGYWNGISIGAKANVEHLEGI